MAYAFRGRDRRLIKQTLRDLNAIVARDVRAANPKKTTILSTRTLILDNNPVSPGLLYYTNDLIAVLTAHLDSGTLGNRPPLPVNPNSPKPASSRKPVSSPVSVSPSPTK